MTFTMSCRHLRTFCRVAQYHLFVAHGFESILTVPGILCKNPLLQDKAHAGLLHAGCLSQAEHASRMHYLEPRKSSYRQLCVAGGDRGRPPRPFSPLINAARPAVPQCDCTATLSAANGGLTPMLERNRSNSLPSRHGVISQKLPPGKLKPCTSLTDRLQAPYPMQRGSHLDGPSPVQNVR